MADPMVPILAQTRIVPLAILRRQRRLPEAGEVIVAVGSRVDSLDVVARSSGTGRLHPVPLGRYMQSSEAALDKYMRKHPGDTIEAREVIASRPQLFGTLQRTYRAPGAGRIRARQGTWLTLELTEEPVDLKALYRGTVVNVISGAGVTIEAVGALVQGVWGGGGEGTGVLKKIAETPGDLLTEDKIDASVAGAILVGGAGTTEPALRRAAEEQAAGMILGGLKPQLFDLVRTLGFPTVVTDGFGEPAMAAPIFELLAAHHGEQACLSASPDASEELRPEVFIPAVSGEPPSLNAQPLAPLTVLVNARVRLLAPPSEGAIGTIVDIPRLPQVQESGVTAWGMTIELAGGERIFTPWENVELID
jgi:hypothetical protein